MLIYRNIFLPNRKNQSQMISVWFLFVLLVVGCFAGLAPLEKVVDKWIRQQYNQHSQLLHANHQLHQNQFTFLYTYASGAQVKVIVNPNTQDIQLLDYENPNRNTDEQVEKIQENQEVLEALVRLKHQMQVESWRVQLVDVRREGLGYVFGLKLTLPQKQLSVQMHLEKNQQGVLQVLQQQYQGIPNQVPDLQKVPLQHLTANTILTIIHKSLSKTLTEAQLIGMEVNEPYYRFTYQSPTQQIQITLLFYYFNNQIDVLSEETLEITEPRFQIIDLNNKQLMKYVVGGYQELIKQLKDEKYKLHNITYHYSAPSLTVKYTFMYDGNQVTKRMGFQVGSLTGEEENVVVMYQEDDKCLKYQDGECSLCSYRYYLAQNGCAEVESSCEIYSPVKGMCLECYSGFFLDKGSCHKQNQLCALADSTGACLQCYNHFILIDGHCYFHSNQGRSGNLDPLCEVWKDDQCQKCLSGTYFDPSTKSCTIKDPFCQNFHPITSICLQCRRGYELKDNQCQRKW